jgi:hypothetical protein
MAISVAFFGLGVGALLVYILKSKITKDRLSSKILQSVIAFAVSLPIFLLVVGHIILSTVSYLYIFYLAINSFLHAGISMALVYLAMPRVLRIIYSITWSQYLCVHYQLASLMCILQTLIAFVRFRSLRPL